jgi:signal transduction histidine kinase
MQPIHAQREVGVTVGHCPSELAFRGETQDRQEMLGNLLDNACKWAVHRVEVNAHTDGAMVTITLDDDGFGLDVQQRGSVKRRGVRADEQVPSCRCRALMWRFRWRYGFCSCLRIFHEGLMPIRNM